MPLPTGFCVLVPCVGGNVQARSGMSREQAVPKVKRNVINVSKASRCAPTPGNDIARGEAAQGRHLCGKSRPEQASDYKVWGTRLSVCWRYPAWNGKSAALLI